MPCAMRDAEKPVPTQPATDRTPMIPPDKFATLRQPGISFLNRHVTPASRLDLNITGRSPPPRWFL